MGRYQPKESPDGHKTKPGDNPFMDEAVVAYFKEKAIQEERAWQRKLAEGQAIAQKKEQEEYEEYLRLKEKFERDH